MRLLTVTDIRAATGSPLRHIATSWPLLERALQEYGILTPAVSIGMAATVAVETAGRFLPIREFHSGPDRDAYFERMYGGRADLGNRHPGDGARFHGRGFIQITGRFNYLHYGGLVGVDLMGDPDKALDPWLSARIAAAYFDVRAIDVPCHAGDWRRVRKLVNGGYNGWEPFIGYVTKLTALASTRAADPPPKVVAPPVTPPDAVPEPTVPDERMPEGPFPPHNYGIRAGEPVASPLPQAPAPRPTLLHRLANVIRGRSPFDRRP